MNTNEASCGPGQKAKKLPVLEELQSKVVQPKGTKVTWSRIDPEKGRPVIVSRCALGGSEAPFWHFNMSASVKFRRWRLASTTAGQISTSSATVHSCKAGLPPTTLCAADMLNFDCNSGGHEEFVTARSGWI